MEFSFGFLIELSAESKIAGDCSAMDTSSLRSIRIGFMISLICYFYYIVDLLLLSGKPRSSFCPETKGLPYC